MNNNQVNIYQEDTEYRKIPSSSNYKLIPPPKDLFDSIPKIEEQLLSYLNLKDYTYEDIPIDSKGKEDLLNTMYIHTLKPKNPSPSKRNLVLIHGYLGSSTNYLGLIPYLKSRFNIYAPDTIGMALSSRPQIEFTSCEQCTAFFNDTLEKWRIAMKINSTVIIGHSLGGYLVGSYVLKYPNAIEKVFLFSPACISDTDKNGGWIHRESGCGMGCGLSMMCCMWPCEPRFQQLYNNCLFTPIMKLMFRTRYDTTKILNELMAQLSEIAMEYPSDLDRCMFYLFKNPFPKGKRPLEDLFLEKSKLNFVFCFGEKDWMDRVGCQRLAQKCPERFKFYIVSRNGHMFMLENSGEAASVILSNTTD